MFCVSAKYDCFLSLRKILTNVFAVLHPYYKLAYIKLAWGGPEEQAAEVADGNIYAKDWQDEARQIIENTVSCIPLF
jgi:hypothetical protein